jgi:choline dehydrogenase-like flavoprotein
MRRAYVNLTTTRDEDALADSMDTAILELAKELAGNDSDNFQITKRIRDGLGTTFHEAGTLWMGEDDNPERPSVTNTNGRFHYIRNAYCTDQSLFVTVGSANPALTGLVLTQKVAKAVVERAARRLEHLRSARVSDGQSTRVASVRSESSTKVDLLHYPKKPVE